MKFYVVGGAVRDLLLGRGESDRDYLVLRATADEFQARYPSARQVGRSFPVYLVDGCEYAWPRGTTLADDLQARDLTINALALPAEAADAPDARERVIFHPLAQADLQAKVLRPASPTAMADDPVRVFRAARFAAQLPDFTPHPELIDQMHACAEGGLLDTCIAERVGKEAMLAMAALSPSRFLAVLDQAGCLSPWFEPLGSGGHVPAGPAPYHDRDLIGHTALVMDRLAGDPLRAWMGLAHDLGKATTDPELLPRHHGHELRGPDLARDLGERLRLPERWIKAGEIAASAHMTLGYYPVLRPGSRVDLLTRLHAANLVEEMLALIDADRHMRSDPSFGAAVAAAARVDLAAILSVHLPPEEQNQGEASGKRLRELRCLALVAANGKGEDASGGRGR